MYIIEMVDDWDRTIKSWIIIRSEEEVSNFVKMMNSGLADKLGKEVNSYTECYFHYRKCEVVDLPTEQEIKDLLKPCEFELSMRESNSSTSMTDEMMLNWDITKVTDMTNTFKNCK